MVISESLWSTFLPCPLIYGLESHDVPTKPWILWGLQPCSYVPQYLNFLFVAIRNLPRYNWD